MLDEEKTPDQAAVAAEPPYSIFTSRQKALIVTTVSVAATFSGFASNIYFPAIPTIALDLGVTPELINLTVTSYMILQGLSPTIWGAVADVHGRRVTYICTFFVLIGACIGLAETRHYYQLVILRCLQSAGSASTIAIGAGVIGDITIRAERGGYMGIYQAGLLSPVAIGPILGGIFSQTLGWHAIFWFLAIYAAAFLCFLVIVLPETLRSKVGNGSKPVSGLSNSLLGYLQRRKLDPESLDRTVTSTSIQKALPVDFLGPIKIIFTKEVSCAIFFLAIYYTVWQMVISILSTLFKSTYGLSELQIGLCFIGNGAGCIIGTLTTGKFLDFEYKRCQKSFDGSPEDFPLEKARLRTLWLWSFLQLASVLVFGWTLQYKIHISVPIICTFILGWAATSIISVVNTFLVDIFPKKSASATASLNLVRCLMGAGGTAAVLPIVNGIGIGWTFTLFTGVMLISLGLVVLQMGKGLKWRKKRQAKEMDGEMLET
ncbi:MFS general substrate transporter [Mollisia scopiformis]|uniref:MFS general substrate transporter n=1 Tax=Mollisia scopiformis TaxID=149040 RepID=A0A194WZS4_MOLSC|nr:MFS general substrate transporter [Mollisia scopiformis]KUJ13443.1 MFS general substrate transporter [Mollisia scopiformis]